MDSDYLKSTVGLVVARACSAVVAAEPPDPIAYLSLWLLKYIENVSILENFHGEKRVLAELEEQRNQKLNQAKVQEESEENRRKAAIDYLRSIKDDPYLLWDACLNAISTFTGSSSSYVAVVVDKLWNPKADKRKKELDEEQVEGVGDGEGSQKEDGEEEEEEAEEVEEEEAEEKEEEEGVDKEAEDGETKDAEHGETSEGENMTSSMKNVKKPLKPPNYKRKTLLYVSATSNNKFMLNMSTTRKLAPVSYDMMTQGLQQLHIPNVLYKQGMHFFGAIPRVGAYFAMPITIKTASPPQVTALLCADTLKTERYGSGRPFSQLDMEFISAVADSITEVMSANHLKIIDRPMTETIIKKVQAQLQQIKNQRKEALKKAMADTKAQEKLLKSKLQGNNQGDDDQEHEADEESNEAKDEDGEDKEEYMEDNKEEEEEEEEEMVEEDAKAEAEEEEQEEGEEETDLDEGEEGVLDKTKVFLKDLRRDISKYRKKLTVAEKNCEKLKIAIETRGQKVGSLEAKLYESKDYIRHLRMLLAAVIENIIEVKETEQAQMLGWCFPSTNIYRVLTGILHILGYAKELTENWIKVREIVKTSFYDELMHYDASQEKDLVKWDIGDECVDDLSDEKLVKESPIGYLGRQWLLLVKDLTIAGIKHRTLKEKTENASMVLADVELESMVAELEVKALFEELSNMINKEKQVVESINLAKNQIGVNETNNSQAADNSSKENEGGDDIEEDDE